MGSKYQIKEVKARSIINSRGWPTVEATVVTAGGSFRASVPRGASRGEKEAYVLYDDKKDYLGRGVKQAIYNIEGEISPRLEGQSVQEQHKIDSLLIDLDGTRDKSNLGANAVLPVSLACARAGAQLKEQPLWQYIYGLYQGQEVKTVKMPRPCFNIINGGVHGGSLGIQEFLVIPQYDDFSRNLKAGVEIYQHLKKVLQKRLGVASTSIGDEGGFTPPISTPEVALSLIVVAVRQAGYEDKVKLALDCAANQFGEESGYRLGDHFFTSKGLLHFYRHLVDKYPIQFIEDPFREDNARSFASLRKNVDIDIIGDDLTVTHQGYIKKAHQAEAVDGIIVKPNQVGTLTETLGAVQLARSYGWKVIASHRSGETNDSFISDLAVGIEADFIKAGAPARGERVAKYNRLSVIESEI